MKNKDLVVLFIIILVTFVSAMTVLPFLSILAGSFPGVEASQTGIFMALVWTALTAGTVIGGRLAEKFQRRVLLIRISSVVCMLAFAPIGYATELWQFGLLIGTGWFAAGVGSTMVRIIAGILAEESERGRVFGVIGAATPLGAVIGGLVGGPIVDRWGTVTLFIVVALVYVVQFVAAGFIQEVQVKPAVTQEGGGRGPLQVGPGYWLLIAVTLASFAGVSEILMGRPLRMDALGFDGTAISGVLIGGGLVALPATFLVGWLSDRIGRKRLLVISLVVAVPGMALLIGTEPLWVFWLSEVFIAFVGISNAVGSAMVADLVRKDSLDAAMLYFTAATFVGSVFGFLATGYLIDWIGLSGMFGTAAALIVVALLLALPIPGRVVEVVVPAAAD